MYIHHEGNFWLFFFFFLLFYKTKSLYIYIFSPLLSLPVIGGNLIPLVPNVYRERESIKAIGTVQQFPFDLASLSPVCYLWRTGGRGRVLATLGLPIESLSSSQGNCSYILGNVFEKIFVTKRRANPVISATPESHSMRMQIGIYKCNYNARIIELESAVYTGVAIGDPCPSTVYPAHTQRRKLGAFVDSWPRESAALEGTDECRSIAGYLPPPVGQHGSNYDARAGGCAVVKQKGRKFFVFPHRLFGWISFGRLINTQVHLSKRGR